jgi:hypothetical protein
MFPPPIETLGEKGSAKGTEMRTAKSAKTVINGQRRASQIRFRNVSEIEEVKTEPSANASTGFALKLIR